MKNLAKKLGLQRSFVIKPTRINYHLLLGVLFICQTSFSQTTSIPKKDLQKDEPYKKGMTKELNDTIVIHLETTNEEDTLKLVIGEKSKVANYSILNIGKDNIIYSTKNKAEFSVVLTSNSFSDEDEFLIFILNNQKGEQEFIDTLTVHNTYPFKSTEPESYKKWNNPRSAEIFIGTNFDFLDAKVKLTDWYGGAKLFLPNIINLNRSEAPMSGFYAGMYHNKSLSNFNNGQPEDVTQAFYRVQSNGLDANGLPYYNLRYDTLRVKNTTEINNWGFYFSPMRQLKNYEEEDFSTRIYIGFHMEVIRRNYSNTYSFDTIGYKVETVNDSVFQNHRSHDYRFAPHDRTFTLYDSYFGPSIPIQFIWKDVLETNMVFATGLGSSGYSQKPNQFLPFYLVQFNLLARLGGLKVNLGGEIRGYLPNQAPIITAYLGTSFSISKLAEFVSK